MYSFSWTVLLDVVRHRPLHSSNKLGQRPLAGLGVQHELNESKSTLCHSNAVRVGVAKGGVEFSSHVVVGVEAAAHTVLKQAAASVLFAAALARVLQAAGAAATGLVKGAAGADGAAVVCDKEPSLDGVGACAVGGAIVSPPGVMHVALQTRF